VHLANYAHLTRLGESAKSAGMQTFVLVCKVCTMFQTLSGKSSKTPSLSNPTPMHTQGLPVSSRSCASLIAASTSGSMLALRMLQPNDAWLLVFFALVPSARFTPNGNSFRRCRRAGQGAQAAPGPTPCLSVQLSELHDQPESRCAIQNSSGLQ
jgi:hypothetical protein